MSEIPSQSSLREPDDEYADEYTDGDDTGAIQPVETSELDTDPFADNLDKELAAAAPKKWVNRATVVLAALFLLVGGFLGGVQVQKHYGAKSGTNSAAGIPGQLRSRTGGTGSGEFPGGGAGFTGRGGTGGAGTGAAAGNTTAGTVKLVDGTTLYITTADGSTVIVNTTGKTTVTSSSTTTLSKLKVGEKVTITGSADSSGTVTATTVTGTP